MSLPVKMYEKNIFINCPFDDDYAPLFEAVLFTILICGYNPRCALESDDAGSIRFNKINKIISECKIGFHDISRTELDKSNQLPRFNMPLELGLFLGAGQFGSGKNKEKLCIVFDKDQYRYMKFISDISGQDIKSHKNSPEKLIRNFRKVLSTNSGDMELKGAGFIIKHYLQYEQDKKAIIKDLDLDEESDLSYPDRIKIITQWLEFYSISAQQT